MVKPILGIFLFSFVFIAGAYFVLSSGNKPPISIPKYISENKDKPIIEVKETTYDMGTIKVSDTKEKKFMIKNTGTKPLLLSEVSSSCGCTTAQIMYKGAASREFSMHGQSDYVIQIEPQTTAFVKIVYKPFTMPVYGTVARQVFMNTNDPDLPKLEFNIKAFVTE